MLRRLNPWVSGLIQALKWPTAFLGLLFFPAFVLVFLRALVMLLGNGAHHLSFLTAFLAYVLFWFWFLRHWKVTWFSTLEHEFTHVLTAWACCCKVVGFKTTWKHGGTCTYEGKTNWLIHLTPYFLPTLCLPVLLVHRFNPLDPLLFESLLGVTCSYHLTSTLRETHREQTDLKQPGWLFAFAFLPSANLFIYAWIFQQIHPTQGWLRPLVEAYGFFHRHLVQL